MIPPVKNIESVNFAQIDKNLLDSCIDFFEYSVICLQFVQVRADF